MAGKFALIVGNSRYDDGSLSRLKAPDADVRALEHVLKAPEAGQFDEVTTLVDEGCARVRKAIARFFDQRQRDDLLLFYFSGHGVKDEQGHLYLALRDTETSLLAGTAIETAFIASRMDRSYSKRQVLMLDCCHSGAFAHGAKAAHGVSVGTAEAFEGLGVGRVVMTATDATQYAWEGDQIIGDAQNSLFTHFVIDGLKTGAADRDGDGLITVDELYDYVREHVMDTTPRQTPYKWTYRQQGDIVLAQNPFRQRSMLPLEIEEAIASTLPSLRLEAVNNLESLLRGHNVERARAARAALQNLSTDDSRRVANAALAALRAHEERAAVEGRVNVSEAAVSVAGPVPIENPPLNAEIDRPLAADGEWRDHDSAGDRSDSLGADIFISYAREDREAASALAGMLSARGWNVWWDRKIKPGEAFDVMIERELCTCKCAVVLWSANSVNATWVRNEARRAARRGVLVPILIHHVETPLEFENLQAADLTSWQPPADHPELDALFERIAALSPIPAERLARRAERERIRTQKEGERREREAAERRAREAEEVARRAEAEAARRAETERIERARVERERVEAARLKAEAEAAALELCDSEPPAAESPTPAAEVEQPAATRWLTSQPFHAAAVVALILAATVATRWAGWWPPRGLPLEARSERRQASASSRTPAVTPASEAVRPSQQPPAGADAAATSRKTTEIPAGNAAAPNNTTETSGEQSNGDTARPEPVDGRASARASTSSLRADHAGARGRGATSAGDDGSRRLQRLRDAQTEMERAKEDAINAEAEERAGDTFSQALREERRATNLRGSGRGDAAAQSFQAAAERFKRSATEARLSAEDEEQEQQKKQANGRARADTPPAAPPAQKPAPLNLEAEKEAVIQTLRRYELAYSSKNVGAIRSIHPGAPADQLTKQFADARSYALSIRFAGEIRFYTFSEARVSAVVPASLVADVVTRSSQRNHDERSQTITLEKQRGGWIITDVR